MKFLLSSHRRVLLLPHAPLQWFGNNWFGYFFLEKNIIYLQID